MPGGGAKGRGRAPQMHTVSDCTIHPNSAMLTPSFTCFINSHASSGHDQNWQRHKPGRTQRSTDCLCQWTGSQVPIGDQLSPRTGVGVLMARMAEINQAT